VRGIVIAVALAACGRLDFGDVGKSDASAGDAHVANDASQAVVIVSDDFERELGSGWGSADVGGAWNIYNPENSKVGVDAGHGAIGLSTTTAYVDCHVMSATALDTETSVNVGIDSVPAIGAVTATVSARWVADGTDYRLHLDVLAGGSADIFVERGSAGDYVDLADGIAPVTVGANRNVALSLVATGASPTTLCGKLWLAGSAEPSACTVTVQDGTPALQVPGISYLVAYDSGDPPPSVWFATFRFLRVGSE